MRNFISDTVRAKLTIKVALSVGIKHSVVTICIRHCVNKFGRVFTVVTVALWSQIQLLVKENICFA